MTDTRLLRQIERLCIDHWTPKYNQWQARQAQDQQGFVTLSIRFSPEDLKAIDREVARHQAVQPGIDFNRSGIIRMLVLQALRAPAKEL
jgi:hypothetical protein